MVVFGRRKIERTGKILFHGEIDQCREYAEELTHADYDSLTICDDGGIIRERIVINGAPVPAHLRNA